MDDSSLFMEWAIDTLQHLHSPPAAGAYADGAADHTFPSLQVLRDSASHNGMAPPEPAVHEGHRATNSWSSGDTDSGVGGGYTSTAAMEHDGWSTSPNSLRCAPPPQAPSGGSFQPMTWNFKSALTQPCNEAATPNPVASSARMSHGHGGGGAHDLMAGSPSARRASAKGGGLITGPSSAAPYAQEHIIAERKRREKINQRFIELSTVIPGLKKMDKATILSDAVRYVKQLQEKLSGLEDQNGRSVESAVLVNKKPCIAASDGGPSSCAAAAAVTGSSKQGRSSLPEIEAKISHGNVIMRIHCENGKGLLVRLLGEVEGFHLGITHTNVMPFPACTAIITIMAKVEDGFSITAEDIVARLNSVLQQHSRSNAEETATDCSQEAAAT